MKKPYAGCKKKRITWKILQRVRLVLARKNNNIRKRANHLKNIAKKRRPKAADLRFYKKKAKIGKKSTPWQVTEIYGTKSIHNQNGTICENGNRKRERTIWSFIVLKFSGATHLTNTQYIRWKKHRKTVFGLEMHNKKNARTTRIQFFFKCNKEFFSEQKQEVLQNILRSNNRD